MSRSLLREKLLAGGSFFSPFFVVGDPTPELSLELCVAAVEAGAGMLELGLPFSDPVADGPSIQRAGLRSFRAGMNVERGFALIERIAVRTNVPINLLVYGNLVHRRGFSGFAERACDAGASSLLVPDIPLEEGRALAEACCAATLGTVQLVGPSTPDDRVRALSDASTAFVYLVGHQGVTGARAEQRDSTLDSVRRVAALSSVPTCVGFGLKEPEHVDAVLSAGARIAVVGSALADLIEAHLTGEGRVASPPVLIEDVHQGVARFVAAVSVTQGTRSC